MGSILCILSGDTCPHSLKLKLKTYMENVMPFDSTTPQLPSNPDNNPTTPYTFGLGHFNFLNLGKEVRGNHNALVSLDDMIQIVSEIETEWQPVDAIRKISSAHIEFTGDCPTLQFRNATSVGKQCKMTRHALRQLNQHFSLKTSTGYSVTPINLTEARCIQDEEYRKLETIAWSKMMDKVDKEVMFRSKIINGERVITSIQGSNYSVIRDSKLLRTIRSMLTEEAKVGVASITSQWSNFDILTNEVKNVKDPSSMFSFHNSDAGTRRLQMMKKMWILLCTNGMRGWGMGTAYERQHTGDVDVIMEQLTHAMTLDNEKQEEFLSLYLRGRTIELDNMWKVFEHRSGLGGEDKSNAITALGHLPLIASPENTVSHLLDGLTLSAQAKQDPLQRLQLEDHATSLFYSLMDDIDKGKKLVPELLEV